MNTENLTMAREQAADESGYVENARAAFKAGYDAGWDAAMKQSQRVVGEEEQGYTRFHDSEMPLG